MIGTQQGPLELVWSWGGQGEVKDGFWSLLSFAMQMALVLVLGSAMASAKACKKALAAIGHLGSRQKERNPGYHLRVHHLLLAQLGLWPDCRAPCWRRLWPAGYGMWIIPC